MLHILKKVLCAKVQMESDNYYDLEKQQKEDEALDDINNSLTTLKKQADSIGNTLTTQNKELVELDLDTEEAQNRMNVATRKIESVERRKCSPTCIIFVFFLVVLILILFLATN